MTEQPWQDRDPNPDDANDAQLPGPEDGPVVAPRETPADRGDYIGIDSPDEPDAIGDRDAMAPDAGH
jgi:hypothetical protein